MTSAQKMLLLQHSHCVKSVAFSPNGDRLLTGSEDNKATIWRATDWNAIHVLSGHSGAVNAVQWSPSGDSVITGSGDGTAQIWWSSTGKLLATLSGHTSFFRAVFAVDWSASGEHVATASYDGTAKIWHPMTGKFIQTTEKHSPLAAVAFSPNGEFFATGDGFSLSRIFSGGSDGIIRIFRTASKPASFFEWWTTKAAEAAKPVQTLCGHSGWVCAVAWSPTGDLIASGGRDQSVRIWEVSTGHTIRTLEGHSDGALAWSPDGHFILTFSFDKTARIWAAATGEALQILSHHTDFVRAVAWSPRGDCIATASWDKTASIICMAPPTQTSLTSKIPEPPSNQQVPTKLPPPPQESTTKDESADINSTFTSNDFILPSAEPPESRCFRDVPKLSFEDALAKLLDLTERPEGRPIAELKIPDDDDLEIMPKQVNKMYEIVRNRDGAKKLIADHGLTPDEVKSIVCYTMENPYKVYLWLNAWLMVDRRDKTVVDHVGPFFALLYQGMEKLPRIHCKASRGVLVRNIKALRDTFDNYKECCKKGSMLSFWGLASFSTSDDVLEKFTGDHETDAIAYSCEELECVSIKEFSRYPKEEEVLPLPPCTFKVVLVQRIAKKLVIGLEQMDHYEIAYVVPNNKK